MNTAIRAASASGWTRSSSRFSNASSLSRPNRVSTRSWRPSKPGGANPELDMEAKKREAAIAQEVERMKADASKGDIGSSELVAGVMAVIVIAGVIGVSIGLFYVGAPVVETVADSFPRGGV